MFDPKKLLDDLLGSQVPGGQGTVRDKAGQAVQLAKDNPIATGAIAAILLGTGAGRAITGTALKAGGLAAIAGLAYKAYQNYQNGSQPAEASQQGPELLPPPSDSSFNPSQAPQGETPVGEPTEETPAPEEDPGYTPEEQGGMDQLIENSEGGAPQ